MPSEARWRERDFGHSRILVLCHAVPRERGGASEKAQLDLFKAAASAFLKVCNLEVSSYVCVVLLHLMYLIVAGCVIGRNVS